MSIQNSNIDSSSASSLLLNSIISSEKSGSSVFDTIEKLKVQRNGVQGRTGALVNNNLQAQESKLLDSIVYGDYLVMFVLVNTDTGRRTTAKKYENTRLAELRNELCVKGFNNLKQFIKDGKETSFIKLLRGTQEYKDAKKLCKASKLNVHESVILASAYDQYVANEGSVDNVQILATQVVRLSYGPKDNEKCFSFESDEDLIKTIASKTHLSGVVVSDYKCLLTQEHLEQLNVSTTWQKRLFARP